MDTGGKPPFKSVNKERLRSSLYREVRREARRGFIMSIYEVRGG